MENKANDCCRYSFLGFYSFVRCLEKRIYSIKFFFIFAPVWCRFFRVG